MSQTNRLLSPGFLALSGVQFLAFCNVAVFFPLYSYLRTLSIDPHWIGFLIGAYSLAAMVVRPVISPMLHPGNARICMLFGCIGFIVVLPVYSLADGFWSMLAVRLVHGACHAVLVSAMLAMVVVFIPEGKSGQAFGLLSVTTLLPYAIIPPMLGPLDEMFGGYQHVLTAGAVVMLLNVPLLLLVKPPGTDSAKGMDSRQSISVREAYENLNNRQVLVLLLITLILYSSFTPVFYFIKGYGTQIGIGNPGLFFTVVILTMIGFRVTLGILFDKFRKLTLLAVSLTWLTAGYVWLAFVTGPVTFYVLAAFLGLGWGMAMPVLNALIFDCSDSRFRGLNINLSQEALQAGFLLGPLIGGWIVAGSDYRTLFIVCALFSLATLALVPLASRNES
jgi:predicted MFS family arabinose efflux permease